MLVVRGAGAVPRPRVQAIRLAVSNLSRPGAATTSVILSLGFGVTVLAAVALIENNLSGEVRPRLTTSAPSYFFIDIQPDQAQRFDEVARGVPGVSAEEPIPHRRGRVPRLNAVPGEPGEIPPEMR